MGDIDNIKDKLLNYHSPLDIDEAWEELTLKQENVILKKGLRTRNILGGALGVGLLIVVGVWVITSINISSNENIANHTHSNKETIVSTETTNEKTPDSGKTIDLDKAFTTEKIVNSDEMQTLEEASAPHETLTLHETSIPIKIKTISKSTNQVLSNNVDASIKTKSENKLNLNFNDSKKQKVKALKIQENTKPFIEKTETTKSESQDGQPIVQSSISDLTPQTNKQYKTVAQLPTKQFTLIDKQTNGDLLLTTSPVPPKYKLRDGKNFVGLELLGQGGFYSLNYGRVLHRQRFGETDIQVSLTHNPRYIRGAPTDIHILMGSLSVNQSFRVYRPHYLTLGLTAVFGHKTAYTDYLPDSYYNVGIVAPKIGYRYHAPGSRIFYKAELIVYWDYSYVSSGVNVNPAPSIYPGGGPFWGGVGIGYNF